MEVLGVIVIMSIIVLITVPIITGIIDEVRKNAYRESVRSIFKATDIYVATNNFMEFPEEGIDVTTKDLKIKHKDFVSGKVVKNEEGELRVEKVSNGVFCAEGTYNNISEVKGDCNELDITPPTVVIISSSTTSNSVTIIAIAEDQESGIDYFKYCHTTSEECTQIML
ncbi:MAG: type II secretion system protein [Mollicutes bacterium]|nr:type II secretion system protein [Mollicutes bacterium]